jgi:hypothetical protein
VKTKCLVFKALGNGEYEKQACEGEAVSGYCAKHVKFYRSEVAAAQAQKETRAQRQESQLKFGQMMLKRPEKR